MATFREVINIGPCQIGKDIEPLFLPDIDVYFKQNLDLAFGIVDQLAEAGCHFIKLAALHDPESSLKGYKTRYWVNGQGFVEEEYRTILERHVLPLPLLTRIVDYIRGKDLALAISVYDRVGIDFAVERNCEILKIPSSNIVHAPLIRDAVKTGIPLIVDTGRSTHSEVERAVNWVREMSAVQSPTLIIEHSPPGPPASTSEANLKAMVGMGQTFSTYYGLSDHSSDDTAMLAAAAMDADIIETGVAAMAATAGDIDLAHALPVEDVGGLLAQLKTIHRIARDGADLLQRPPAQPMDRMGLVAKRALQSGEIIDLEAITFAFPAIGIPVEDLDKYLGARVIRPVEQGCPVTDDDLKRG